MQTQNSCCRVWRLRKMPSGIPKAMLGIERWLTIYRNLSWCAASLDLMVPFGYRRRFWGLQKCSSLFRLSRLTLVLSRVSLSLLSNHTCSRHLLTTLSLELSFIILSPSLLKILKCTAYTASWDLAKLDILIIPLRALWGMGSATSWAVWRTVRIHQVSTRTMLNCFRKLDGCPRVRTMLKTATTTTAQGVNVAGCFTMATHPVWLLHHRWSLSRVDVIEYCREFHWAWWLCYRVLWGGSLSSKDVTEYFKGARWVWWALTRNQ